MTSSLAFPAKLKRLVQDPRVAMAYFTREHGFATAPHQVLAQGTATVPAQPSPEQLALVTRQANTFFGDMPTGRFWDWALREYVEHRVIINISLERVMSWPSPDLRGAPEVYGRPAPQHPDPQAPPTGGTGPRVDTAKFRRQAQAMSHQVIGYRGGDGLPVIAPVQVSGHSERGLHLDVRPGLLPPGGRRAGFAAHAFRPYAAGVSNRVGTGWLTVTGDDVTWAPHTSGGFSSPPNKSLHLLGNGLLSKHLIRKYRRDGTLRELDDLRAR